MREEEITSIKTEKRRWGLWRDGVCLCLVAGALAGHSETCRSHKHEQNLSQTFFPFLLFHKKKKTLDNPVRKTKITVTCAALSQYLNTIKT